jgi:hypothetical protein
MIFEFFRVYKNKVGTVCTHVDRYAVNTMPIYGLKVLSGQI